MYGFLHAVHQQHSTFYASCICLLLRSRHAVTFVIIIRWWGQWGQWVQPYISITYIQFKWGQRGDSVGTGKKIALKMRAIVLKRDIC